MALANRDRWGVAFALVGGIHLATFLVCHAVYSAGVRAPYPVLSLWAIELAAVVAVFRRYFGGPERSPKPELLRVAIRVWITFLILCFSAASLNNQFGMPPDWFKPVWATLATFGFATMAWIFDLKFLIPAVQMSLTGLIIVHQIENAYLIYGVSWCVALCGVGTYFERKRNRTPALMRRAELAEAG
jgi:hypothetical protein